MTDMRLPLVFAVAILVTAVVFYLIGLHDGRLL